ncbi:MAG: acylphosphatase [Gammaproteobacteria bacterium]|nr:acylphosphatase [Gammaproteobacteria bacterium]
MRSCCRFRVRGRVQGVCFRADAQQQARRLGVAGYIRNAADGSVEGLACGETAALSAFRNWLSRGPQAAAVESLEWQPNTEEAEAAAGFEIRR